MPSLNDLRPAVLRGKAVYLEPLEEQHAADLFAISRDEAIWKYLPHDPFTSEADAVQFIRAALRLRLQGSELAYAIRLNGDGALVGTVRYQNIQAFHGSVEVGWGFVHPSYWGRAPATECGFLLCKHAFEDLGATRVWFKTDERNQRSQGLLARYGIVREGVLRKHLRTRHGFLRNSVIYSILDDEWPRIKELAETFLASPRSSVQALRDTTTRLPEP